MFYCISNDKYWSQKIIISVLYILEFPASYQHVCIYIFVYIKNQIKFLTFNPMEIKYFSH